MVQLRGLNSIAVTLQEVEVVQVELQYFANQIMNEGTIETNGGAGGKGPTGFMVIKAATAVKATSSNLPIPGVVAQTYANGIEIWLDGQNVTAQIGDPNGKEPSLRCGQQ